jgi:hypothetical protein
MNAAYYNALIICKRCACVCVPYNCDSVSHGVGTILIGATTTSRRGSSAALVRGQVWPTPTTPTRIDGFSRCLTSRRSTIFRTLSRGKAARLTLRLTRLMRLMSCWSRCDWTDTETDRQTHTHTHTHTHIHGYAHTRINLQYMYHMAAGCL